MQRAGPACTGRVFPHTATGCSIADLRTKALAGHWPVKLAEVIDRVIVRENSDGISVGIEYPAESDKAKELIKLRLQGAGHSDNGKTTMLESFALLNLGR